MYWKLSSMRPIDDDCSTRLFGSDREPTDVSSKGFISIRYRVRANERISERGKYPYSESNHFTWVDQRFGPRAEGLVP
jgi:hypothetical protein